MPFYHDKATVDIRIIGQLWWGGPAATARHLRLGDGPFQEHIEPTQEAIEDWIGVHTGDFSAVDDWTADITTPGECCPTCGRIQFSTETIPWTDPDSDNAWTDCMYPVEAEGGAA